MPLEWSMADKDASAGRIAENRRARYDYFIEERFEAGVALQGWEVKALRAGRLQLQESYVLLKDDEAWLFGAHVSPLPTASTHVQPDPTRSRKLLLHRRQIDSLVGAVERKGRTIVPLVDVLEERAREARDRPRQRQERARQARRHEGTRLAAREGARDERTPLRGRVPGSDRMSGTSGGDRLRRGLRNSRGMPRCRLPR